MNTFLYFSQIDSFMDYLERNKHPKWYKFFLVQPKQVMINWKTIYNDVDCGVFLIRHMETYVRCVVFLEELKQPKITKEVEAYTKKQPKISKFVTDNVVKVDQDLSQKINESVLKTTESLVIQ